MTNVLKSHGITRDNGSGGFLVVSGKVLCGDEHDRLSQKTIDDDDQQVRDNMTDAQTVLKHSIGEGHEIVARAKAEAEEQVAKAKEQGFKKGYDEGFGQGFSEGTQLPLDEKEPIITALSQLSQRLSDHCENPSDKYEYLDKAIELAKSIINIELEKDDEGFFELYRKAALHISNVGRATLKAGPKGYAVVQRNKTRFESAIEGLDELNIMLVGEDDGLCILETPLGNIDASVGAQLSRAKNIISPQVRNT